MHWACASGWRSRSAGELSVPAATNAVSSGSKASATGSDAHADSRPVTLPRPEVRGGAFGF
jgi:hypothetical protein